MTHVAHIYALDSTALYTQFQFFDVLTISFKSQLQLFLGLASKGCFQSFSVPSGSAVDSGQVSELECA